MVAPAVPNSNRSARKSTYPFTRGRSYAAEAPAESRCEDVGAAAMNISKQASMVLYDCATE